MTLSTGTAPAPDSSSCFMASDLDLIRVNLSLMVYKTF